ncbi:phospholipase A1 member A [Carettochelys insculpta]|uniref:phospholipase A1 member A n=1 Tax=Carettochelys insculpta TaxID=44489 RepID=UPI003EB98756
MGSLTRNKAEDHKKQLLFILAVTLLLSSACAGHELNVPAEPCSDFQAASILRGSKLKIQFLLFTSSNSSCGHRISSADDIKNSNFNTSLDTKIIIHGFRAFGRKPSWINRLISAFFQAANVNVVAVDWVYGATGLYSDAVENVTKLSLEIYHFIRRLLTLGVPETSIHLIGVSLGAHVAGLVGYLCEGHLGRITGLDPAGPKYTKASHEERLDPGDALFVEAIHTDTDNFGIRIPVGHIDYFINGGKDQPGCSSIISGYNYLICDHLRAVHLYVSALENSCPMMAYPCSSHENFLAGHCLDCSNPFLFSCPRIGLLERAGVSVSELPKEAKVYLETSSSAPYCMYHSLVEFRMQQGRSAVTSIEVTFRSSNSTSRVKITIPKQQMLGKGVLAHPVPLCQIEAVMLKYVPKRQIWKKDETLIVGKFCTIALPVSSGEKMFCLSQHLPLTASSPFAHGLAVPCV